jgi:hypothetical protein
MLSTFDTDTRYLTCPSFSLLSRLILRLCERTNRLRDGQGYVFPYCVFCWVSGQELRSLVERNDGGLHSSERACARDRALKTLQEQYRAHESPKTYRLAMEC